MAITILTYKPVQIFLTLSGHNFDSVKLLYNLKFKDDQGGHKPEKHGRRGKLREFENRQDLKDQGKLREI